MGARDQLGQAGSAAGQQQHCHLSRIWLRPFARAGDTLRQGHKLLGGANHPHLLQARHLRTQRARQRAIVEAQMLIDNHIGHRLAEVRQVRQFMFTIGRQRKHRNDAQAQQGEGQAEEFGDIR
jgi:hypothetical protein